MSVQSIIDSDSLFTTQQASATLYFLFDSVNHSELTVELQRSLPAEELHPLFSGTGLNNLVHVSPIIVPTAQMDRELKQRLFQSAIGLFIESCLESEFLYALLKQHFIQDSDQAGQVLFRFYSLSAFRSMLDLNLVGRDSWGIHYIALPNYSRQGWLRYEIREDSEPFSLSEQFSQAAKHNRLAYWIGSLPCYQSLGDEAISTSAVTIARLIDTGITQQTHLMKWADWLSTRTELQRQDDWLELLEQKQTHNELFLQAEQIDKNINVG